MRCLLEIKGICSVAYLSAELTFKGSIGNMQNKLKTHYKSHL